MAKKPFFRSDPEARLQHRIIEMLRDRGWFVKPTHGNAYSRGWPDLFCYNPGFLGSEFGPVRWIDVKIAGHYKYTKAQCQEWPIWEQGGVGIWIMMEATEEWYIKLFQPPNWREYWKPAYDKYLIPVDDILRELDD